TSQPPARTRPPAGTVIVTGAGVTGGVLGTEDEGLQTGHEGPTLVLGHGGGPAEVVLVEGGAHAAVELATTIGQPQPVEAAVGRVTLAHQQPVPLQVGREPADAALVQVQ